MGDEGVEWEMNTEGDEIWMTDRPVNWLRYPEVLGEIAVRLGEDFSRFCWWAGIDQIPRRGVIPRCLSRLISHAMSEWRYIVLGSRDDRYAFLKERDAMGVVDVINEEEDEQEVNNLPYLSVLMGRSSLLACYGRLWSDDAGDDVDPAEEMLVEEARDEFAEIRTVEGLLEEDGGDFLGIRAVGPLAEIGPIPVLWTPRADGSRWRA
jgi:hypothetical protein